MEIYFDNLSVVAENAKQELQRRGVKTVDEAIAVAESLNDFRTSGPSESSKKEGAGHGQRWGSKTGYCPAIQLKEF
uniref:Uncharacterized protein n=1 Tax=Brassica oleracea var. oleracea TaxID=109376 RepID=A0A0D2ZYN5_BRAOL